MTAALAWEPVPGGIDGCPMARTRHANGGRWVTTHGQGQTWTLILCLPGGGMVRTWYGFETLEAAQELAQQFEDDPDWSPEQ